MTNDSDTRTTTANPPPYAPTHFALSSHAPPQQKAAYQRQEQFLETFARTNSETAGCMAADMSHRRLEEWKAENYLGFRDRYTAAKRAYCDWLEQRLGELIAGLKPGQNVTPLAIALNAEMPEKYRPQGPPADQAAQDVLSELRRLAKGEEAPGGQEQRQEDEGGGTG